MRRLILAATLALGLGAIPGTVSAAPAFAVQTDIAAPAGIELVQNGYGYRRGYGAGPRYGHRGRGYGRYYGGPPRAYGRRYNNRRWDRRW